MGDILDIVEKLDNDFFQLRMLPFDHVLKLQKWMLFNCCKPLECNNCENASTIFTVVLIICGRLADMCDCLSGRLHLAKATLLKNGNFAAEEETTTSSSNSAGDSPGGHLLKSATHGAGAPTCCNYEMFSPEFRAEYSQEEQLHMIRVLAKIQVRNLNQLLMRLSETSCAQSSEATIEKIFKVTNRLKTSAESIDESLQAMIKIIMG